MNLQDLAQECGKKGITLSQSQLNQFEKYANLLVEWNDKMNLTAITDFSAIVEKHFFDSIQPLLEGEICGKVCDVGAGAGFPSIPLKIVNPSLKIFLLEPITKRCTFLNEVISQLELSDITVINKRSEDYVKDNRESFDVVIARAVANLSVLSELCIPLVKENGSFVAMKAEKGLQEAEESKKAITTLGCKLEKVYEFMLNDSKRVNLIYRKIKKTPIGYPRQYAKIKKNPLWGELWKNLYY